MPLRISIIIPTLNEEACLRNTLTAVSVLRPLEIIVADGGSVDGTVKIAREYCQVVQSRKGRGLQQRTAAETASGDVLWFLHADTIPGPGALEAIQTCLLESQVGGGNFSLCFSGDRESARQLTLIYPWLRYIGLCYGDSGIFVRRAVYDSVGGFQPYPLFEDVDLVRRISRVTAFRTLPEKLLTSSRRFEHRNFAMMFAEWTALQVLFWAGISPHRLARWYQPVRKRTERTCAS
jgi:rSAM/selenodomain-associated transferase 2